MEQFNGGTIYLDLWTATEPNISLFNCINYIGLTFEIWKVNIWRELICFFFCIYLSVGAGDLNEAKIKMKIFQILIHNSF